jgi:tRNA 2-thiouridine synthesizing protein D
MTTFALLVLGAPHSTAAEQSAWHFAQAAVAAGHRVFRVFFFHDGVQCGNALQLPEPQQPSVPSRWQQLARDHQVDLVVCIASAMRRGVTNAEEASRHQLGAGNLAEGFDLSGLGQWVEASILADRVVTFGP